MFTDKEKKLLLELISNEQIHMIIKDHTKYESEKYKMLERLKILVKDSEEAIWFALYKNIRRKKLGICKWNFRRDLEGQIQ